MGHPFPSHQYSPKYVPLLNTQSNIGWLNLLRGFASTKWSRLHLEYLTTHKLSSTDPDSLSCVPPLVDHLFNLWQFCNAQRHSADLAQHQTELHRQACHQICELYRYKQTVIPTDCHIFCVSLVTHLQESLTQLQAWLHNHAHYILDSHQQAQRLNTSHTHPITHYLSSIP